MTGWNDLEPLFEASDIRAVAELARGLSDEERRALVTPLKEYERRLRRDWGYRWSNRATAVTIAGAACLSGATALAPWLARGELREHVTPQPLPTSAATPQEVVVWQNRPTAYDVVSAVLDILIERDAAWLPGLIHRLAERLRVREWSADDLWRLVAGLTERTGIDPPLTDGFVLGLVEEHAFNGSAAIERVRRDPRWAAVVLRAFEVEQVGGWFGQSGDNGWPAALAALTAEGLVGRDALLDACLGALQRGGRAGALRGFLAVHEAIAPTLDELAARARDYAALLPDGPSTVAGMAQDALFRLDDARRLELDTLLDASRSVLLRSEKKLVRAQLKRLDAVARRGDSSEVVRVLATAFGQEAADLQERALSLTIEHASPDMYAELAEGAAVLPADFRKRATEAFGGDPSEPTAPVSGPPAWSPSPPPAPIGSPSELAEEFAALWAGQENVVDPVALERVLAALVAFAWTDRAALRDALDPVMKRYRMSPGLASPPDGHWYPDESHELSSAIGAAVTPPAPHIGAWERQWQKWEQRWRKAVARRLWPGPERVLTLRLHEIAIGLAYDPRPILVSPPTTASGLIDPAELLGRLERLAAEGLEPWPLDLEQALLRLPRQVDDAIAVRARRIGTAAATCLADRLADGGLPFPEVTRHRHEFNARHWGDEEYVRDLVTMTSRAPVGSSAAVLTTLSASEFRPARYYTTYWMSCWPAMIPAHRDISASHLALHFAVHTRSGRGAGPLLPMLAEADGPIGVGMTLALAYGLGAHDRADRACAVDALLILAARERHEAASPGGADALVEGPDGTRGEGPDWSALGGELGTMARDGVLSLNRVVPALTDLARSGVWAQTWEVIAAALPPALEGRPQRLADLLALGVEVAGVVRPREGIPALKAVAERGGSSRLVAEARRLTNVLP
ncbi:DUF6493 family protein [Actinoallomurus sp. CA-150999]|uniref:DUF6493 family protein n=1 Tax=Actinoallomurus sp. CA-150999 TaxID=3239887 RepID=UPI003D8C0118